VVRFIKYKNIEEFLSQLHKLDKGYYLQPVLQKRNEEGEMRWIPITSDEYLTPEDFVILFEHCRRVLEPRSLGALPMSVEQCKTANLRWYSKIVNLLNSHLVQPEDIDVTYLFQMGASDTDPICNQFKLVFNNIQSKDCSDRGLKCGPITPIDHLQRQLDYLRRSCDLYDAGHLDEAVRMAVVIRVLIHDTKKSKSLLQQMHIKEKVKLLTSFGSSERLPENFHPISVLPILASSAEGGTSAPFPLSAQPILMSVNEWWEEIVWKQKSTLTRKDIVLGTANKEGGAHVQVATPETIQELRQGLSQVISFKINGVEFGTPEHYHLILIRQFAYELLNSKSLTALTR
jgi:hypothetical protein